MMHGTTSLKLTCSDFSVKY